MSSPLCRYPGTLARRLALALATVVAGPALAAPNTPTVTVEPLQNGSRIVFSFPRHVAFGLVRQGDTLALRFTRAGDIPGTEAAAPNIVAVHGGTARATVDVAPGSRVLTGRQGNRIVVDVMDPAGGRSPPPPPPPAIPPIPQAAAPAAPSAPQAPPPNVPPPAAPAADAQPAVPTGPEPLAAAAVDMPAGTAGSAAILPFGSRVGAAAFRRGGAAWVVFDERRPIDLAALQDDKLLSRATIQMLTASTLLRLPLPDDSLLRLTRSDDGWTVAALPAGPPATAIAVVPQGSRVELAAAEPNQVVVVPDPDTGTNLLVGTLRGTPAGVPVARRLPAFAILPTWQGVVVEPISDSTTLRVSKQGFILEAAGAVLSPQAEAVPDLAAAAFLTRRFDIATGAPDALFRRLQAQIAGAGEAPPQSRGRPRKAAAATMIALGLGAEAQGMLRLASEEDPRLVADPETAGLSAIAAMLGGRMDETAGIADPALGGSDEVALWRAIRAAQGQEGAPQAAPVFAATVPLLLAYPAPLRNAILPLAVETMAVGGAPDAADAVLARFPNDPGLALARAIRLENKGDTSAALAEYDAIALGRDRLPAARAAARATLLRLKTKAITPGQAAEALERQFLNWRGDGRELDLRLRVAALRAQSGAWRAAFTLLRETASMYPDDAPMIHSRMVDLLTTLVSGTAAATISPLELVALTEENAELVASVAPAKAAGLMADKLVALDLPRRAAPVLDRMMRAAPVGVDQATLGARLAALRMADGDDAGAQMALANSNAPGLPQALIERRAMVAARLAAKAGHTGRATAILATLDSPAASDLAASLLADAQDWPGSAAALQNFAAKTVPDNGPLTPAQQDTLLRLASALSRAGDDSALRVLGAKEDARMDGPKSGMFRLLTAAPVNGVGDLPRASSELALAKTIPRGLGAIGGQ